MRINPAAVEIFYRRMMPLAIKSSKSSSKTSYESSCVLNHIVLATDRNHWNGNEMKTIKQTEKNSNRICPKFKQLVSSWDMSHNRPVAHHNWHNLQSPSRRPLDFFCSRFDARMKTGFILITRWNFDPYRLPQFGDNFMKVQPERTRM